VVGASVVICLGRGADLHMAQLMPLPLTVSCFSKIKIGFTFLVPAHLGGLGQRAIKRDMYMYVTCRLTAENRDQLRNPTLPYVRRKLIVTFALS